MADDLVLVTGASGAVGPAVVRACLADGRTVRTLSLDAAPVCSGVDARVGDICDPAAVRSAVEGAQVVVHLAALLHQFKSVAGLDREFERINVGGTDNVVRAAVSAGVRRLVFLSTIAVYGPSSGRLIDEGTVPMPETTYARTKLAAEKIVLSATSGGRPLGTVLRSAAIYGARVKGNYRRLAESVARRRFIPVGRGLNRRTVVHDEDLARAILLAASHPHAAGEVFNVTDGRVHTLAEIINAIYMALGRRPPRMYLPLGPVTGLVGACEAVCRAVGVQAPVTKALLDKYSEDVAVSGAAIGEKLAFRPIVDLETGWQESMAAILATGGANAGAARC